MKVKRFLASNHCFLTFRIRVPYEYVDKLRILCNIYKHRTVEHFVKELVIEKVIAESDLIDTRKKEEDEEEKRFQEYWKQRNSSE